MIWINLFMCSMKLCIPIKRFTSPPEDSLPLLRLYFRSLVTGTLKHCWCPVLYVVALSHINSFIFSQDAAAQVWHSMEHIPNGKHPLEHMETVLALVFLIYKNVSLKASKLI